MAWDLQINLQTGDLVFNSIRDLTPVQAENTIQQRIHTRLMIDRGSFIYDELGQLGSRVRSLLDMGIPRTVANLEMLIREALEPMDDFQASDVEIYIKDDGTNQVQDPNAVKVKISGQILITGDLIGTPVSTEVLIPV